MPENLNAAANPQNPESDIIKNIVATETGEGTGNILEAAPEFDRSLLEEVAPPKSVTLVIFKSLFGLLVLAGLASLAFFSSQLTNKLDFITARFGLTNISEKITAGNAEILSLQTDFNFYNYLQAKAYLDQFSFEGDAYINNYQIAKSQTASNAEKNAALSKMKALTPKLKQLFLAASDKYSQNFTAPLVDSKNDKLMTDSIFEEQLRNKLNQKAGSLANSGDLQAKRDNKNYQQTINLIGQTNLKNLLVSTDFDALTDEDVYNLIKQLNALIVNDMNTIQQIKEKRVKWSDIMNEIDVRTAEVDSHYSENFYEDLGGIRYTSYDFDTASRQISIIGETKRVDTMNFTMIADLIDELNRSQLFANGEMRSFSKNGSIEDGYTATLKLSLDLEEEIEITN